MKMHAIFLCIHFLEFKATFFSTALKKIMLNSQWCNFEATITKFCTHADEHCFLNCIDFHKHRLTTSYHLIVTISSIM